MTRYAPRISEAGEREIEKSSFVSLCESLAQLLPDISISAVRAPQSEKALLSPDAISPKT